MQSPIIHRFVCRYVSVAIISMGFVQVSGAGVINTQQMIDSEVRQERLIRLESYLLRQDVANQLIEYGVAPEMVTERIKHMTGAELAALEGKLESQIAGGDALGVIGAVFLVLLILELVGVTDIFKSI